MRGGRMMSLCASPSLPPSLPPSLFPPLIPIPSDYTSLPPPSLTFRSLLDLVGS